MAPQRDRIDVSLIGDLRLRHAGATLPLPTSRKTRALFVYLLLCGKAVRRERLCETFFDIPDDPRAALRWSLSKIRQMLAPLEHLLETDRELVSLRTEEISTDVDRLRSGAGDLSALADVALDVPLPGLDLPGLDSFNLWLATERASIDRVRAAMLLRAAADPSLPAERRRLWESVAAQLQAGDLPSPAQEPPLPEQHVLSCFAADGARIAYACTGEGPPLVKAANWLNHLELDWAGPHWGPMYRELSRTHRLVRYDERGCGLSDWAVADISFEAFVADLETVANQVGIDRFPLFGISQGCAVSIAYAARHPERVSRLVLLGGYAAGWRFFASPDEQAQREAVITLARHGWGQDNPVYRQLFSQTFMPSASHDELDWFNEYQRQTASPQNAVRFLDVFAGIDVRADLARVRCPTLVLHARGDQRVPIAQAMSLAAGISGARLVTVDTDSHVPLGREAASAQIVACIEEFLSEAA